MLDSQVVVDVGVVGDDRLEVGWSSAPSGAASG
jgi:hypothetical protein